MTLLLFISLFLIKQVNNALESLNNELDTKTAELQAYIDNNFAITASIPTKISDLVNDSNLVNSTELNNAINNITTLIPNTATVENQLTDKNFWHGHNIGPIVLLYPYKLLDACSVHRIHWLQEYKYSKHTIYH